MVINDIKNMVSKDEYMALLSIDGFTSIPLSTKCYLRKNGNYQILFLNDGTKLRFGAGDSMEPDMPECIDITISKWCKGNCPYCYLECTTEGRSANLKYGSNVYDLMMQLPEYTEVAININDITYYINNLKGFTMFLEFMEDRNLFVNATINMNSLSEVAMSNLIGLHYHGLLRGIGVSVSSYHEYLVDDFKSGIGNDVVYQVIAGIIDPEDIVKFVEHGCNVLVLGYKDIGRGSEYKSTELEDINRKTIGLERIITDKIIPGINDGSITGTISFDGLAIEQLHVEKWIDPEIYKKYYAGDEGAYTFYLDLVDMRYGRSSIEPTTMSIDNLTMKEMFDSIRVPGLHN